MWHYYPNGYIVSKFRDRKGGIELALIYYDEYSPRTIIEKIKRFFKIQLQFYECDHMYTNDLPAGFAIPKSVSDADTDKMLAWRNLTVQEVKVIEEFITSLPTRESIKHPILNRKPSLGKGDVKYLESL